MKYPVATNTVHAEIIGEAETEAEAVAIIRAWAEPHGFRLSGAKLVSVMIDRPQPGEDRFPQAWIATGVEAPEELP